MINMQLAFSLTTSLAAITITHQYTLSNGCTFGTATTTPNA
jgi:hypothetical protein